MQVGGRCKREGIYAYIELVQAVVMQKLSQHCKAIIFQLKKKDPGFSDSPHSYSGHPCPTERHAEHLQGGGG